MPPTWSILTPLARPGAVAIIQFHATPEEVFRATGVAPVPAGGVGLRDLCGVDEGLVAHWAPGVVQFMPHGGPAVLRRLGEALERVGLARAEPDDPASLYPEAEDLIEARMLHALSRAPSPLAIDLLLDQPRRWRAPDARSDPTLDAERARLLSPPLVVAVGAPNIGKSTLLNALAGRSVAAVADQPGTTRDYVGALLDLGGLVVRYADTPGFHGGDPAQARINAPAEEHAAALAASALVDQADLVLRCVDAGGLPEGHPSPAPAPASDPPPSSVGGPGALTVALRTDLHEPRLPHDVAVSAHTGAGIGELVRAIRDRLLPARALEDPSPWRFWA